MRIQYNNCFAYCDGTEEELDIIWEILSFTPKSNRYVKQEWQQKRSVFHKGYKRFPTGLLDYVLLQNTEIDIDLVDIRPEVSFVPYEKINLSVELRDYQEETVNKLIERERGIVKLPTGSGKCCAMGTIVTLRDRQEQIHNIDVGDEVKTFYGYEKVSHKYEMGYHDTIIIEANGIYKIECTPEHPLMVVNDGRIIWKQAHNLVLDDILVMDRNCYDSYDFQSDDLARMIGYLIADGALNSPSISFTNDDPVIKEDFEKICYSMGITYRKEDNNDNGSKIYKLHGGIQLREYFEDFGLDFTLSRNKSIPYYIYKGLSKSREFLRAYLGCESYANKKGLEFSSASKKLMNQVSSLLLNFGASFYGKTKYVKGRPYYIANAYKFNIQALHDLDILSSKISNMGSVKDDQMYTGTDAMPAYRLLIDLYKRSGKSRRKLQEETGIVHNYFEGDRPNIGYRVLDRLLGLDKEILGEELNSIIKNRPFFSKVTNLIKSKNHVFDITVPHRHHYIANGFYSHNTASAIALTQKMNRRTLFIVNRTDLAHQTQKEYLKKAGIKAGIIGDGKCDIQKVTVATIQSLASQYKKNDAVLDCIMNTELAIFDEVHRASRQYQDISSMMKMARWRLGLSATALIGEKEGKLHSQAITGPLIYEVKMKKMVDRGYIAKPYVYFIKNRLDHLTGEWNYIYEQGIVFNQERNLLVCIAAKHLLKKGKSSLILVERKDHGDLLCDMLSDRCRALYIDGDASSDERKQALSDLQTGMIDVLISTKIFNEGIDIPLLEVVIVAAGYKKEALSIQRYGRGIRKTILKDETTIVDFLDEQFYVNEEDKVKNGLLHNHALQRLKACRKDKAYEIIMLDINDLLEGRIK